MNNEQQEAPIKKYRIAFFVTHPIQYFSPLFKEIESNSNIDLTVYYFSGETIRKFKDKGFNLEINWDIDLLGGYKYKFLNNNSIFGGIYKPPFGLINLSIIRELDKNNYDEIIIHGWNYFSHWIVFVTAFFKKIPLILRSEMPLKQELKKNKLKIIFKKVVLGKILFNISSAFLSIGIDNEKFYKFYGVNPGKIFFAPYAVDNKRFHSKYIKLKNEKEKIKASLNLQGFETICLFVGKLIDKKRPLDLLKAFHVAKNDKFALLFVGDGELRKDLTGYIKAHNLSNVFLLGFKNQKELPSIYTMADLFILPSGTGETWGLVVNEAMNFGLPVIVSKTVGCSGDLVKEGENGFTFEEGNIEELAHKIAIICGDNEKLKSMGKKSLEIISEYSYDNIISGILNASKYIKNIMKS